MKDRRSGESGSALRHADRCLAVIRSLLPSDVAVACAGLEDLAGPLHDVEARGLGSAVEARRHEFALGRTCARAALADLGLPQAAIPVGEHRAPVWPAAVVGSIAHSAELCVAAVANAHRYAGLGVDVERLQPLPAYVADLVVTDHERGVLQVGDEIVVFSAKETVFKVWWPLMRTWLGFEDVAVLLDHGAGTFTAQTRADAGSARLKGRFKLAEGMVFTALALPR
jgi:4'-phosphopantetheinyl transferase EntD